MIIGCLWLFLIFFIADIPAAFLQKTALLSDPQLHDDYFLSTNDLEGAYVCYGVRVTDSCGA